MGEKMDEQNPENIDFTGLQELINIINERAGESGENSYTASLLSKGVEKCAEKLGEEAIETVIALVSKNKDQVIYESADLIYHLLVALKSNQVEFTDVIAELERRQGVSGHAEKASRR